MRVARLHPRRALAGVLTLALGAAVLAAPAAHAATAITNSHATGDGIVRTDGQLATQTTGDRVGATLTVAGRTVTLHLSDTDQMGWATLSGGQDSQDRVWLDRSFDGWVSHDGLLGEAYNNGGAATTGMYNDANEAAGTVGELRACMHVNTSTNPSQVGAHCTTTARTTTSTVFAGVDGLDSYYSAASGLFSVDPTGTQPSAWVKWWQSAVATSAIVGAAKATGDTRYNALIDEIYTKNVGKNEDGQGDNFRNKYIDDTGWWAMAWIDAYRLTGQTKYLNTAKVAAQFMTDHSADPATKCGGVYWRVDASYHAAISNSLYLQVVSALYDVTGDSAYRTKAQNQWTWYQNSGLIGDDNLVHDGMGEDTCTVASDSPYYTYNQGALLSALTEYYHATNDASALTVARAVGTAFTTSTDLNNANGIMVDSCEGSGGSYPCGNDGPVFKGPGVRGLSEANALFADHPFTTYLNTQLTAATNNARDLTTAPGTDQYALRWYPSSGGSRHVGNQVAAVMLLDATYSTPAQPSVSIALGKTPTGSNGWFTEPVSVSLTTASPSLPIEYSMSSTTWAAYQGPITIATSGIHSINARTSHDTNGLTGFLPVKVDLEAPEVGATTDLSSRTLTVTAVDRVSGVAKVETQIGDGAWITYLNPIPVGTTRTVVKYRATDNAGRVSAIKSATVAGIDDYPYSTVSTVQVNPTKAQYGSPAKITVGVRNVSTSVTDVPTGTITVKEGSRLLASGKLPAGRNAQATTTLTLPATMSVGNHRLTVTYSGSAIAAPSTESTALTITKAKAKVSATGKKRISPKARAVYSVKVTSPTTKKVTGKVTVTLRKISTSGKKKVSAKKSASKTVKLRSNARTKVTLPKVKRGTYQVTVSYGGSSTVAQGTLTKKLTVR